MTFHSYIFFSVQSSFHSLPSTKKQRYKKNFLNELQKKNSVNTYSYTTLGLKRKSTFLLWFQADSVESIQDYLNELLHTEMGLFLKITYTLFGMIRPSQYSSTNHSDTRRKGGTYLIIYPFTKTKEWYSLSFEQRKELMKGHIAIGRNYPQITQLLLYSYGVDDQEFIVSYETDDLLDFQSLVIDLRADKVRAYTLNDTPIFTCLYKTPEELIAFL
ncbi:MAG TPA: chlorite dismutase family protein [Candidatus Saccharimonadales bacterium]|nr:chlorite dismutase family protein [Candidatus Saccharimonadales bacterium]